MPEEKSRGGRAESESEDRGFCRTDAPSQDFVGGLSWSGARREMMRYRSPAN